ncbi:VanZ family protein [Ruania zhangjianzhongii]|uniref:VanZ family protein n=1 Tax=Ruania zhangjianzhongii TaxID=2603206 RepID=UPI001AEFAC73|nr:VanZ family protein [Ruania zhangjianzhongii]
MTTPAGSSALLRAIFVATIAVQLIVLYLPQPPSTAEVGVPGADKAIHVLVFALVMLTGVLASVPARWLALVLAAHAVLSEVVQHLLLPSRSGDPLDAVADLAGIALGWYVASMITRHRLSGAPRR